MGEASWQKRLREGKYSRIRYYNWYVCLNNEKQNKTLLLSNVDSSYDLNDVAGP